MTQSIQSRFAFSLGANLLKALVTFGTGMLVARGLGPEQYGKMMFLLGTFTAIRQLFDVGSSAAFFTFLSQRQRSIRFVAWFFAWLGVQFIIPVLAIGLLFPVAWIDIIWNGEQRSLILLAFVAAYMQSTLWSVVLYMAESQRLTRRVQSVALAIALLHFLLIALFWRQGWLDIRLIFAATIIEWCFGVWAIGKQLYFPEIAGGAETFHTVFKEFGRYCLPLIPYSWLGFAYEFTDRWLMQNYGGSVQQAFYAVAYQFGAIAAIATSAILNVFWKEIAEAHQQENKQRVALLYRKVSRGLFFVAASVAGFLVPWAEDILRLILGSAYVDGSMALTIMFLYPLHQSMGQIGNTMMYATGRVRAQLILGAVFVLASIVVSYFVLAPIDASIPGFGLGSIGLAGKMVVLQFLGVNAVAFYLARSMQTNFDWVYQPLSGIGCFAGGWLAYFGANWLYDSTRYALFAMLTAAPIYLLFVSSLLWVLPSLAGVTRDEILSSVRWLPRAFALAHHNNPPA